MTSQSGNFPLRRSTGDRSRAGRVLRGALFTVAAVAAAAPFPAPLLAQSSGVVRTSDLPATAAEAFLRLVDQGLPLPERRAAAMALLNLDGREGVRALTSVLNEGVAPSAWRAVAEAIAIHPSEPPRELWEPLVALLTKADPSVQPAIAEALGRFGRDEVVQRLYQLSVDPKLSPAARRGAILALGHQRTQATAEFLVKLTDIGHPEPIQDAAFEALATLSGMSEYGRDRALWLDWWDSARRWNRDRWQERIMANLARRDAQRRAQQQGIEERLIESQRALYRTTTPEDRPAVLAYMLGDPLPVIRQLGVDLALQRLVDDLPFDEPLRQALRGRVGDPNPDIRRRATLLLRDLADAPAADRVADRLAGREEQVVAVLRADLLMMSRLPRAQAVEPTIELLDESTLRGEAAGALAAAADADMLDRKQKSNVAKRIRKLLESQPVPPPQVATLLGKVGDEEDWSRIAGWIDSPDPQLKRAAAAAWAESGRSLQLLADRVTDPIIEPIVISAAIRQGDDPWTLRALSQHRPSQPQAAEAWEQAMVAMSGRVAPDVVLETVQRLQTQAAPSPLLERMLTAALQRRAGTPSARLPLHLKRAEVRMAAANPAAALTDYDAVVAALQAAPANPDKNAPPPPRLGPEARDRMNRGRIEAYLQTGQPEPAFAVARELLNRTGGTPSTDDPVVDGFVEAARRYAEAGQREDAREVMVGLRAMLGPALKPEVAQRLALLEAEIAGRGGPATTGQAAAPAEPRAEPVAEPASPPRSSAE